MSKEDIQQIAVSGRTVGIIGFNEVLEELKGSPAQADDDLLGRELVVRLSKKNYIPEKIKDEYARALAREFRRQSGQSVSEPEPQGLTIRVLGQGCANCRALTQRIMEVLSEINLVADFEHVTDIKEIARYHVMGSPALIINGKLLSAGTVPSKKQLVEWIKQAGA
jgi:small redox-active disulfide protein 2